LTSDAWERLVIGDVAELVSRREHVADEQIYKLMGVRLYGNGCRLHTETRGSELKADTLARVHVGDITYNKMWTTKGAFAVVTEQFDGYHATFEYPTFRADTSRIDLNFFGHVMRTPQFVNEACRRCRGSTSRARLNPQDFLEIPLLLPPFAEQQKIAEILGSVDQAIRATQAIVDQTRKVKQGLLQQLLTRGIGHTRFKQTEIGEIPKSWSVCCLADVLKKQNDALCYGILQPGEDVESGVPMLRTVDIDANGQLAKTQILRVSKDIEEGYTRTRLRGGEVLLSVMGTVGRAATVDDSWIGWNVNRALAVIRVQTEMILPQFLYMWLRCPMTQKKFRDEMIGSAQQRINLGDLLRFPLPVPPIAEQHDMARTFSEVERVELSEEEAAASLVRLKTGLMADLLSGRVRVKVTRD
jgi:type I restriction enzyme S subunit